MAENPIKTLIDRTDLLDRAVDVLTKTSVLVGVPSDDEPTPGSGTEARTDTTIGNAALAYIHENGSPINNLPARPFLGPGVTESKDRWGNYLKQAAVAAFEGKPDTVDRALNAAGMTAVSAVKAKIQAGIPPPLSERTIEGRRRRAPSRKAAAATDVTPLIDTGQLINSISYVLRRKDKK